MIFQYDSLVEPISQDGETITLDKWQQPTSNPVIKAVISTALIASLSLVEVIQPVAASTDWIQPTSQPLNIVQPVTHGETVLVEFDVPEPRTDWMQPTSQPLFSEPDKVRGATVLVEVVEAIEVITDWFQPQSEPYFIPLRLVPGETTLVEFAIPVPKIDWQPTSQPLFKTPENTEGQTVLVEFSQPGPRLIEWFVPIVQPIFARPPNIFSIDNTLTNIASVELTFPGKTHAVISIVTSRGIGLSSPITEVGIGVLSSISDSEGLLTIIQARGVSVSSPIESDGEGLDSDLC